MRSKEWAVSLRSVMMKLHLSLCCVLSNFLSKRMTNNLYIILFLNINVKKEYSSYDFFTLKQ